MKKKMRFSSVLMLLLCAAGIVTLLYPFITNWINQNGQVKTIENYDQTISNMEKEKIEAEKEASRKYNVSLLGNVVLTDPFDNKAEKKAAEEYEKRLNINGDGTMGYIEIPKIGVELSIAHGTSAEVLDRGVGHLENTSLPIGGKATHAVLSAHTAYAKATLFNDLVKMEEGDQFYLTVLDEKLAYQVDQIKVVVPEDTSDLMIDRDEDYVTLVTCTPYGVNSHRLLVRGTRVPYVEEEKYAQKGSSESYWKYMILAGIILIILIVILSIVKEKKLRRKKNDIMRRFRELHDMRRERGFSNEKKE